MPTSSLHWQGSKWFRFGTEDEDLALTTLGEQRTSSRP